MSNEENKEIAEIEQKTQKKIPLWAIISVTIAVIVIVVIYILNGMKYQSRCLC